ncbi:prepilin-type N-terminal cleavage/methylation domain-containing protein [Ilyobacter polytropus]|uniref:Prepilin-type N-terminal cleavage/methylation domain-containing protein n=1 Tax=Ilyobacter polytropus (strain ATCC 51220 / DSM 2926 / LMG 16218 / CuHBu1) TaxID=572544 RepID=E3H6Y7_ILYPC|nr:prepilin-type N-terminal cleavage/methylation domain-containing protein [Ilyobacter polytropus]ADO82506.1 hypothetical protein Ilyop_0719 [Ilyobacter polytropus DSM 2926]
MKKKGYTAIELVIVVAIILVVTGIGGLSMLKAIKRNDYNKMLSIIPKAIFVETNKAFEEGESKTITLDLSSKSIETEDGDKSLPENYTYSVGNVTRSSLSDTGTYSGLIASTSVDFDIDSEGKINNIKLDGTTYMDGSDPKEFNSKDHPSILVKIDGESFCRIDIISSLYITPKIKVYKPDGSDWILDSRI